MVKSSEHADHGGSSGLYLLIFALLTLLTLVSFIVNRFYPPPNFNGAAIILGVATLKAFLVCLVFMHLRWDWSKLYFLIIPAFLLGAVVIVCLIPDMVSSWDYYS